MSSVESPWAGPGADAPTAVDTARRRWLELAAALAFLGAAPPALAQAAKAVATGAAVPDAAAFAGLSQSLTGYPAPDAATAAKVHRALATPQRRAALVSLAQVVAATAPVDLDAVLKQRKLDAVARDVVAAWYSGVVSNPGGDALVLYTSAFMWTAMTWTKPMGVCGGVTGYWADPPQ